MTTKHRILFSFIVMMVLLAGIATVGYRALNTATDNFMTYDSAAKVNVFLSDTEKEMNASVIAIEQFFISYKDADIKQALKKLAEAQNYSSQAYAFVHQATTKQALQEVSKDLEQTGVLIAALQKEVLKVRAEYDGNFQNAVNALIGEMNNISETGRRRGNAEALAQMTMLWNPLALIRRDIASYMETLSAEKATEAQRSLDNMQETLKLVDAALQSEMGRKDFAKIDAAYKHIRDQFASLRQAGREAREKLQETHEVAGKIQTNLLAINKMADTLMQQTSRQTLESNESAQSMTFMLSAASLILGAGLAVVIVLKLVKVLSGMSEYANRIAMGDFSHDPKIHEKGEVGSMMHALHEIPHLLDGMITHCDETSRRIAGGAFRARLDETELTGRYRDLAMAVNRVAIAYTDAIDGLPVGIMTASANREIRYMNTQLQNAFKGEHLGERCSECFQTDICGSQTACLGAQVMATGTTVSGEVQVSPDGARMDFSVAASPLRDSCGKILGFMETLSNVTEVRQANETMLQVAHEAADISTRLAAATEQLSVQVEQVANGAEEQRRQIESTVSAMTQMSATIVEVADSAAQASEHSESSREHSESGAGLVDKVADSVHSVNDISLQLQDSMQHLGEQAESIGSVLNVISDIADQTNLLALNAAIEAARAGEAGRGFAVVADEVRKLAEKTMDATKEVESRISAIQHATSNNITHVQSAVSKISEATNLATSSGQSIKEVVGLVSTATSLMASIASAAEEQSATSEEITAAITSVSQVVNDTTDGMVQCSEAVRELSQLAQDMNNVMQRLR